MEARHLDTDARVRNERDVDAPTDTAGQMAQLASEVARLHPDACMRSFDRGAASFLDASHLVVAHYSDAQVPAEILPEPVPTADHQQPLFVG